MKLSKEIINSRFSSGYYGGHIFKTLCIRYGIGSADNQSEFLGCCGHKYKTSFESERRRKKAGKDICPECSKQQGLILRSSRTKLSNENNYIKFLLNTGFELVGGHKGAKVQTLHKHTICGHEWEVTPNSIKTHLGCPLCAEVKKRVHYKEVLSPRLIKQAEEIRDSIYLIKNELCLKIGVTNNIERRVREHKLGGFNSLTLQVWETNVFIGRKIEKEILGKFKRYNWKGAKFSGYTELLLLEDEESIIAHIHSSIEALK